MSLPSSKGKDENGNEIYVVDAMIDQLTAQQEASVKKSVKKRAVLSKEEFHRLRALCKRDLFFLATAILGNKRLSTNLHGNLCTHVSNTENDRFREFLLPRGHFKSTILTIAHSIQIVLPYTSEDAAHDDKPKLQWPYTLGPDCRILIAHETAESAARFLFAITRHFTSNSLLQALFPDAIPDKRKHRINKWELELPRSADALGFPEPTIDTFGVGGKSQGRHYNYIKLDDIFGEKARDSAAERETTQEWFDGIQSFFSTVKHDHMDLIGTRYSLDDIYAHAEERYEKKLVVYCRRVEETVYENNLPVLDSNKRPIKAAIFPEEFDEDTLSVLRKNKKRFSAEYENDPDAGSAGFNSDWKKFFYWTGINTIASFSDEGRITANVRDLDICILIDPGEKSGGFAVTGVDYLGRIFVLFASRIELMPPDLTEMVFRSVMRWQPRTVAIESDLFANVYQFWWISEMSRRGVKFHITPVYTKQRAKDDRIMGLSHYMEDGKFFINEKQTELQAEWKRVGKSRNVHIFDALAYGPEVWRPGFAPGQRDMIENPTAQSLNDRDPITGYSKFEEDNMEVVNA